MTEQDSGKITLQPAPAGTPPGGTYQITTPVNIIATDQLGHELFSGQLINIIQSQGTNIYTLTAQLDHEPPTT